MTLSRTDLSDLADCKVLIGEFPDQRLYLIERTEEGYRMNCQHHLGILNQLHVNIIISGTLPFELYHDIVLAQAKDGKSTSVKTQKIGEVELLKGVNFGTLNQYIGLGDVIICTLSGESIIKLNGSIYDTVALGPVRDYIMDDGNLIK